MREITQEIVRKLFDYDPESGVLRWKDHLPRELYSTDKGWRVVNSRNAGKRAGREYENNYGYKYRAVSVFRRARYEHRVIWLWMTGYEPEFIDHINRDATDNRWVNLREATRLTNNRNLSRRKDNRSGVTGVGWRKDLKKWQARVKIEGKDRHLGFFRSIDEAAMVARDARAKQGYSPGHGEPAHYH